FREAVRRLRVARNGDDAHTVREAAGAVQMVERRIQLAIGQVPFSAHDQDVANHALSVPSLIPLQRAPTAAKFGAPCRAAHCGATPLPAQLSCMPAASVLVSVVVSPRLTSEEAS